MIKTNSLTVNEIKECSQKVRQYFHIKDVNCFPIYDVLLMLYDNEEIGIQILDDTDMQLPKDTRSEYDVKENFIYVKESVLKELEENNYRNNFTLCHEFFHFLQCKVLNLKF
jgi:Zn-dependent peptidase ImmA (M78 family)